MCATGSRRPWRQGGHWIAFAVLACALDLALSGVALAQTGETQAEVKVRANLRAGPGKRERIRAVLAPGERVKVLRQEGDWTKVQRSQETEPPREGWVNTGLLRMMETPAANEAASSSATAEPEQYLLQVTTPVLWAHRGPDMTRPVAARLEEGAQFESDAKRGDWYHIKLANGGEAWVRNAPTDTGTSLSVVPFPANRRMQKPAAPGDITLPAPTTVAGSAEPPAAQVQAEDGGITRARPQGQPIEPGLPVIDPSKVPPPARYAPREAVPVPDRWRIVQSLGLLPYDRWDPYNPNELKGDLPISRKKLGEDWFLNITAISDTLVEGRQLPTPVGAQSTRYAGSNGAFGLGNSLLFTETGILSFSVIKGDTVFRPPDLEFRFVPVVNYNRLMAQELRTTNINPSNGVDRDDSFVGVQELFVDKHLRNVSDRYDFDSLRFGIQPFTADFRGFLFQDQPFGARFFGTRDNNRWQYNLAWLRRLEKDTNSGLNDVTQRWRADDVFVANLYRQDWPVQGFTTQGVILYNRNREGDRPDYYNGNGFLERPAVLGTGRPYNYDVTYLGANGDGHYGRWNLTASGYYAVGSVDRGQLSGVREDIGALFGALELSRDFDWIRIRANALYASGDRDPYDNKAQGFDAVLENPQFAGADTSYWIRQSIPFVGGGGTALTIRNGVLPSLRSSREHGQSNFTNPGLHLLGMGADLDVSTGLRFISNISYLEFDNVSSLEVLRNQRLTNSSIGVDFSIGVQYRPMFTQNVVFNASFAQLVPSEGLKALYGNAVDGMLYSAVINMLVTF